MTTVNILLTQDIDHKTSFETLVSGRSHFHIHINECLLIILLASAFQVWLTDLKNTLNFES